MSDTRERVHCLRALPDVPGSPTVQPELGRSPSPTQGETADAVSQAMVGFLRARTGRGPTKVRTVLSLDLAIVTFEDYATPMEETLLREGHRELAYEVRTAMQEGMRAEAVGAVERITGRRVAAYLTAHQHGPDTAVIAFHFDPAARLNGNR